MKRTFPIFTTFIVKFILSSSKYDTEKRQHDLSYKLSQYLFSRFLSSHIIQLAAPQSFAPPGKL